MTLQQTERRLRGRTALGTSPEIDGKTIATTGRWLRIAALRDEELIEGEVVPHPRSFLATLKANGLRADIFTFAQGIREAAPKFDYPYE